MKNKTNQDRTVCIIDDDPTFVFIIKRQIRAAGFLGNITVFTNGQEALNAFADHLQAAFKPDIIFLDIFMPIIDGWEFLKKMGHSAHLKESIIHMVTVSINPITYRKADLHSDIAGITTKPILTDRLRMMLDAIVQ